MATYARYEGTAVDDAGNVLASPSVQVNLESSGALVTIYSDRAGATPILNPFTGNTDGTFGFHVLGGAYKVTVTKTGTPSGTITRIMRYVAIGTGAEADNFYTDGAASNIFPASNDGAALGTGTKSWSDLFLASGGVINWNNADVTITHSADLLTIAGGNVALSGGAFSGRVDPRLSSAASGDISPDVTAGDLYIRTALAAACAINAPTGTPVAGDKLTFRLKDNGTGRALSWNAIFRAIGVTIPLTTTANKTLYVAAIYNATDTKWDVLAVNAEA